MCDLSVEELQSYLQTRVNVRNVCLQLPNIMLLIRELCQTCSDMEKENNQGKFLISALKVRNDSYYCN
jgi:hypothetical protein